MRAITELELLRGNIKLDELRMSFGKDKYEVYENMVNVKLSKGRCAHCIRVCRTLEIKNTDRPDGA